MKAINISYMMSLPIAYDNYDRYIQMFFFFSLSPGFGRKKESDHKDNILKAYLKKVRTHSKNKKAFDIK